MFLINGGVKPELHFYATDLGRFSDDEWRVFCRGAHVLRQHGGEHQLSMAVDVNRIERPL